MKKHQKIKDNIYFNKIIEKGNIIKSPFFNMFFIEKEEIQPKFGLAVGKKIGNAVIRNKYKRKYWNIITLNKNLFQKKRDYIIIVKERSKLATFFEIEKMLKEKLNEKEN